MDTAPEAGMKTASSGRVTVMPALDGLRALAVLAVIGYHGAVGWLGGGYYGVDAFLVLSGFLITTLLVAEWDASGGISLTAFWARRARRLIPALLLMLSGVAVVVGFFPGVLSTTHLFSDALASIFYVANWHLAAEHASYFSAYQAQSPLLHTWTLAIEEQFYVLWPLVILAVAGSGPVARRLGTRSRKLGALLSLSVAGALASAAWMAHLVPAGDADPSRAYYGTDTRAQGLLIGAALAIVCALWGPIRTAAGRQALGLVGVSGAIGIGLMWDRVPETSSLAFHGGFLLVSLACAAVVAAAARVPASPAGLVLGLRPLRYLGRISYGMYLWYWPVLLIMTGARTGVRGYPLLGLRLVVIVGIASASYRWVETPIRRGALSGWRARVALPAAAGTAALGMLVATSAVPAGAALAASPVAYLASPGSGAGTGASPAATGPSRTGARPSLVSGVETASGGAAPGASGSAAPGGTSTVSGSGAVPASSAAGSGLASASIVSGALPASAASAGGADGTAQALRAAVTAAGAKVGGTRPVRILLVGDSMAGTLGVGFAQVAQSYGAQIVNEGQAGCSVSMDGQIKVLWYQMNPDPPCVVNQPNQLLNDMSSWVAQYDPDVVVYLARSEVLEQDHAGQWQYLGEAGFDSWVQSRFLAMVPRLEAGGAKVVLMTTPYYDTGEEGNGEPWPEDAPSRVVEDNSIITSVAHQDGVTLVNLNGMISPGGKYATVVDGVSVRCRDGAHISAAGGRWVAARVLPELVSLGRSHSETPAAGLRTQSIPSAVPTWYHNLAC